MFNQDHHEASATCRLVFGLLSTMVFSKEQTPVGKTGVCSFREKMMKIVAKFGGTSMATADSIQAVARILAKDSTRSLCVVSAPGRTATQVKVTDLLIAGDYAAVEDRFYQLITALQLGPECLSYVVQQIKYCQFNSLVANRAYLGEYLSAYLLAQVTGRRLVDARYVIQFNVGGKVLVSLPWSPDEQVVIPGYYGQCALTNQIALFPRGGSDITGAFLAVESRADIYENWTDVSGVYCSNPRQNPLAKKYDYLSHIQMEALAQAGAEVFHHQALAPLQSTGIPVVIKNTFAPEESGTIILGSR